MNIKPAKTSNTVVFMLLFIILISCFFFFINFYTVSPLPEDVPVLIIENTVIAEGSPFIIENDQVLLSYNIIKEHLDPYIFWDVAENKITITTFDKTVRLATESLTAMINNKPVEISFPAKKVTTQPYIPIHFLEELYDIKVNVISDKNRVIIDKNLSGRKMGTIASKEITMKLSPIWFSAPVVKLTKNDAVTVYSLEDGWFQVRTKDGLIGYVPEQKLEVFEMPNKPDNEPKQKVPTPGRGKLNMVWHYIYRITPDMSMEKAPPGLDIISPTWFSIVDGQGTIESKADISYIKWAHENNLAVWALIDNSFDPDITHEFLSSSETRDKIIRQILMYAELFQLDGINIDFENIPPENKELLVQFVRELAPLLREQGLTVSVDVTFKSNSGNWSLIYDRKALGEAVDYVAVMAYDEHWASSPVPGSVASLPWVEKGLQALLEEVPSEKILLGVPLYARLWTVAENPDGPAVTSRAWSMGQTRRWLRENRLEPVFDPATGQHFAELQEEGRRHLLWLEDETSLQQRVELVHKYGLAGIAAWQRGFAKEDIWPVLKEYLRN